ncbi:hypothetical protein C8R45DRAFT_936470 [Mycena sanguinolenta]|nr:hypothetical protein C8R45DRAFT_936470 [Mycena sanguinolenta]
MDETQLPLGNDNNGATSYKQWKDEWTQLGAIAAVLFGASYNILSLVCLFFGLLYAVALSIMFGKSIKLGKPEYEMENLIQTRVTRPSSDDLWKLRILLSMPAAWIVWGVVYFAAFMVAFLWSSGATNEKDEDSKPSPKQEYGPRVITTFTFFVGDICLGLMIRESMHPTHSEDEEPAQSLTALLKNWPTLGAERQYGLLTCFTVTHR